MLGRFVQACKVFVYNSVAILTTFHRQLHAMNKQWEGLYNLSFGGVQAALRMVAWIDSLEIGCQHEWMLGSACMYYELEDHLGQIQQSTCHKGAMD